MNSNYFIAIEEDVELDDIIIDTSPKDKYDNEYDEEVTMGNVLNGYTLKIYDGI